MHECHETNIKCKAIPGIASIRDRVDICTNGAAIASLQHMPWSTSDAIWANNISCLWEMEFGHSFVLEPPRFSASVEVI